MLIFFCETLYIQRRNHFAHTYLHEKRQTIMYRSWVTSSNCQNVYQAQSNQSHFVTEIIGIFHKIIEIYFQRCGAQYTWSSHEVRWTKEKHQQQESRTNWPILQSTPEIPISFENVQKMVENENIRRSFYFDVVAPRVKLSNEITRNVNFKIW